MDYGYSAYDLTRFRKSVEGSRRFCFKTSEYVWKYVFCVLFSEVNMRW